MREWRRILDEIAYEIEKAIRDVTAAWRNMGEDRPMRQNARTDRHPRSRRPAFRFSDLATDGSCAMRNALGHFLNAAAVFFVFTAIFPFVMGIVERSYHPEALLFIVCLAGAVVFRLAGRKAHESADMKRYAQYQHRLLRLAREKRGSLTVLEAATDGRMTVEKAGEILRALNEKGSAEVRVSESGLVVYHFPEIERGAEKHGAKPVDEL